MKLAAMFGDHAVLQRERRVPVWGWTLPRLRVRVTLGNAGAETLSGADGRFLTWLPPMPAGGPFTLEVNTPDPDERVVCRDVLVGEVWLCSGQSNMDFTLGNMGAGGEREIDAAEHPQLRSISIPRLALAGRQSDVTATWQVCQPETARAFTAVGYFFARMLQERLHVPVGLINAAWGGSRIEPWISRESLVEDPELRLEVERCEATSHSPEFWAKVDPLDITDPKQRDAYLQNYPADPGNAGVTKGWARSDCDDSGWQTMTLPTTWQKEGHVHCGVFWFRRNVDVPADWAGKDLVLGLGAVDKQDVTYFNGEQVGATGKEFEQEHWNVPRNYCVPGRLVKAGRNVVAVRVYSFAFHGGLIGPGEKMRLGLADNMGAALSLVGDWRFAVEHIFGQDADHKSVADEVALALQGHGPGNMQTPGILFDNMIAPVAPYGLRGALWYQGESNAGPDAPRYRALLERLIRDWRHVWGQGDFAFLTVQLANFMVPQAYQEHSGWALVREAQLQSLELPETGLAVAIDIGEAADIHPKNKRDVGRRLAQWALTRTYGMAGVPSGPLFTRATIERDSIRLHFRHVGGGLVAKEGALRTFVIAGSNHRFMPADAVVEGDTVRVSCPKVPYPMAVRYAWADNPDGANLYNAEGFPAAPFRSDVW